VSVIHRAFEIFRAAAPVGKLPGRHPEYLSEAKPLPVKLSVKVAASSEKFWRVGANSLDFTGVSAIFPGI
jgi:hypothetical protein